MVNCKKLKADIPESTCIARHKVINSNDKLLSWSKIKAEEKFRSCKDCKIGIDLYLESGGKLKAVKNNTKLCLSCKQDKDIDEFSVDMRSKDNRQSWCKKCQSKHIPEKDLKQSDTKKLCPGCKQLKPFDKFGLDKRANDKLQSYCRDCQSKASKEYRDKKRLEKEEHLKNNPPPDPKQITEKQCTKCLKTKPLDKFHNDSRAKTKTTSWCKGCYSKRWTENKKEPEVSPAKKELIKKDLDKKIDNLVDNICSDATDKKPIKKIYFPPEKTKPIKPIKLKTCPVCKVIKSTVNFYTNIEHCKLCEYIRTCFVHENTILPKKRNNIKPLPNFKELLKANIKQKEHQIVLDFSDMPELLKRVKRWSERELRDPDKQIIYHLRQTMNVL